MRLAAIALCLLSLSLYGQSVATSYLYEYELHEQADGEKKPYQLMPNGWSHYVDAAHKDYVRYLAAGKVPKLVAYVPPSAGELAARRRGVLRGLLTRTDCLCLADVWAGLDEADQKTVSDFRKAVRACFGSANPVPDAAGVIAVLKKVNREE